jgi:ABC-2 type transport system ATP-binding protein
MRMAVLQAVQLGKQYNGIAALSNLNLSIDQGEVFCLLGQNGAGKTTTINLFLGFVAASSGQALINGVEVRPNETATQKMVAYIPEVVQLYGNLSGIENLDYFSRLAGYRYSHDMLGGLLQQAGLQKEAQGKKLATYSKGMRQKVGIAIALAKNADLVFMDEPTSGLDPKATAEFTQLCRQMAADGKTIFMATHDIFNAVNVGTRIGIMKQGLLVKDLRAGDVDANSLQQIYLETI